MRLFLFWNGDEMQDWPAADHWANWPQNIDTARLAWGQLETWRRLGFHADFISTRNCLPMNFRGRLAEPIYPEARWRLWAALAHYLADCETACVAWATLDVFNRSWHANSAGEAAVGMKHSGRHICSLMDNHISLAAGLITLEGCRQLVELLHRYDRGELEDVRCDLPSDESILRERGEHLVYQEPVMGMSHNAASYAYRPLLHFPRSELLTFRQRYEAAVYAP